MGNETAALEDYNIFLIENPNDVEALEERADIAYKLGSFETAIDDYTRLLNIDSYLENRETIIKRVIEMRRKHAREQVENRDFSRATEDLKEILKFQPADAKKVRKRIADLTEPR